ncbi:hypothetical protein EVG20_g7113 [Dentipellis fragilis]|uniref:Integrase catalytic domain-containing protein n=1 Tax=Dentipellis fragilis TaxID=205917 RepID=A0A4Y9YHF7_9AGAM|nr:hypothetical protein EVG20_g7113 [Dentipellis fragilis]
MARTIQKPKKSTSAVAPRKHLREWEDDSALVKKVKQVSLSDGEVTGRFEIPDAKDDPDADYCNRCDDGGATLVECDNCKRVHCSDCVNFSLSDAELANIFYFCFQCHMEEERGQLARPYVGLYERTVDIHGNATRGKPLRSTPLRLIGQPSLIASQRTVTAPLVIIHLHLSTCFTTSTEFISSIVTPYFKHHKLKRRIVVRDINFNLGSNAGKKAYATAIKGLLKALKAIEVYPKGKTRALVVVSTHSDENRGDLFAEPEASLCHADSFRELKRMIHEYRFANVLTFTAPRLQPCHVKPFLLQLMEKHFIQGYPLTDLLPSILQEIPPKFGRHTGIIHLRYSSPAPLRVPEPGSEPDNSASPIPDQPGELLVLATKYQWHSGTIQPWGVYIPDQCPACLCLRKWDFGKPNLNTIQPITVRCRGRKELQAAESFAKPDPAQLQNMAVKKSKGRDRGKARRKNREKLQCQVADAEAEDSKLVPCTYAVICDPPAAGFKWVKPVSDHVQGKWMSPFDVVKRSAQSSCTPAAALTNWVMYHDRLSWALGARNLESHLTSESMPATYALSGTLGGVSAGQRWTMGEAVIKQYIAVSVPDTIFNRIKGGARAKDVWDSLKKIFEGRSRMIVVDLRRKLQSQKCGEKDNVRTHFDDLADLREQLTAMGDTISENDYTTILLGSLPSTYDSTITAMTATAAINDKEMKPDSIVKLIMDEFEHQGIKDPKSKTDLEEAFSADAGQKKGGGARKRRDIDIECFNCKKRGHVKVECWVKGGGKEGQGLDRGKAKDGKDRESTAVAEDEAWAAMGLEEVEVREKEAKEQQDPAAFAASDARTGGGVESELYDSGATRASHANDYSRYTRVDLLRTKDQTLEAYKAFAAWMRTQHNAKIKHFHSDHGGEYTGKDFEEFLWSEGMERRLTTHDTPQHNGVAEAHNRRLLKWVCAILHHSGLPKSLWGEGIMFTVWLKNRTSMHVLGNVTAYEHVYREKPDLSGLLEWGQKVRVHDGTGSKLDGRAVEGRWVGFDKDSTHAHRIYWQHKHSITVERDVKFSPDGAEVHRLPTSTNAAPDSSEPPAAPPTPNVRPSCIPKPSAYVKQIQSGEGMTKGPQADPGIFIARVDDHITILAIHIDDSTLTGSSPALLQSYKEQLNARYTLTDLGPIHWLLGIKVTCDRDARTISLSQTSYIDSILARFNFVDAKPLSMPMIPGVSYSKDDCPTSPADVARMCCVPYREAIGSLMYAAVATRPDIVFAISTLLQFLDNPGEVHWEAVKCVFHYLAGTKTLALTFGGEEHELVGYTDADGASQERRRAILGYAFLIDGSTVSWMSRKQELITLSTVEAEYITATHATKEGNWLRRLLGEILPPCDSPTTLFCNNQATIKLATTDNFHACTKHNDICYHFIHFVVDDSTFKIVYCPTEEMVADALTKALPNGKVKHFAGALGLCSA